jgi:hypothetical protein
MLSYQDDFENRALFDSYRTNNDRRYFSIYHVIVAIPEVTVGPEERESNRCLLTCRNRDIGERNSERSRR